MPVKNKSRRQKEKWEAPQNEIHDETIVYNNGLVTNETVTVINTIHEQCVLYPIRHWLEGRQVVSTRKRHMIPHLRFDGINKLIMRKFLYRHDHGEIKSDKKFTILVYQQQITHLFTEQEYWDLVRELDEIVTKKHPFYMHICHQLNITLVYNSDGSINGMLLSLLCPLTKFSISKINTEQLLQQALQKLDLLAPLPQPADKGTETEKQKQIEEGAHKRKIVLRSTYEEKLMMDKIIDGQLPLPLVKKKVWRPIGQLSLFDFPGVIVHDE